MKRKTPAPVPPLTYDFIEYRVHHFASAYPKEMKHDGGYLEAVNTRTGKRITFIEIYPKTDANKDVFIKSLRIEGVHLLIEDELGNVHKLSVERE